MIVLIIIGSVILILAIINWEQSNGFFRRLISQEEKLLTSDSEIETLSNSSNTAVLNGDNMSFDHDEEYAYNDDNDYL